MTANRRPLWLRELPVLADSCLKRQEVGPSADFYECPLTGSRYKNLEEPISKQH